MQIRCADHVVIQTDQCMATGSADRCIFSDWQASSA